VLSSELFKELCEECQLKKRKLASKGLVDKPIVSKEFNFRGQMDLIDMQCFVGVSGSHERLCTLAINPLIEI
jgi:hypothetical protein